MGTLASVNRELGDFVRRQRRALGLTQVDLADAVEMSQRWVSDIERGVIETPRLDTLHRLSRVLHAPIEDLVILARLASSPHGARDVVARGDAEPSIDATDDTAARIAAATADWSARQRRLLWTFIDGINAAMDERDDDDDAEPAKRVAGE